MRINTFFYSIKQGFKNIFRNKMFSLASIADNGSLYFYVWSVLYSCDELLKHG